MSLTRIGSIGINTGIAFAGVTTIVTLNTANDALSIGATVNVGSGITLGASGDIFATGVSTVTTLKVGSGVNVGVGITRAGTTEDVKLLKNAPIPQGSSLEFMGGNKVVLETTDTLTVDSDTNNSVDAALTIMEIT